MFNLDKAIAAWRLPFRYHRGFETADVDELERHVRDQVGFLVEQGMDEEAAFHQAIREMGGVMEAEPEYRKIYLLRLKHNRTRVRELLIYGAMLKNYLTIAYRNLLKNKTASFINLFGLSVAIACALVTYAYVEAELNRNTFHEHADSIFLVQHLIERQGEWQTWATSPVPLGPALVADLPHVEEAVRLGSYAVTITQQGNSFGDRILFADPSFFDVFTFPLSYGDHTALRDPNAIILSAESAARYFGEANPLGASLVISLGDYEETFTVQGVAAPFPPKTGIRFNLLTNYAAQGRMGIAGLEDWATFTWATFVRLDNAASTPVVTEHMASYRDLQRAAHPDWSIERFQLANLVDLPHINNAQTVHGAVGGRVKWDAMLFLSAIALFLLLLACLNYVNIALASASRRLREIGVRKAVGGTKQQLVLQFLTENSLLCLFSLLGGTLLAQAILLPGFSAISNTALFLSANMQLWLFLGALLLSVALLAGGYPAVYIAGLKPIAILRRTLPFGGKQRLMQALLTVQFVVAFITMLAAVAVLLNASYQRTLDWGYAEADVVVLPVAEPEIYTALHNAAEQDPNVVQVTGTHHHIGRSYGNTTVTVAGTPMATAYLDVGEQYAETLRLRLRAGRLLGEANETSHTDLVVNEQFILQQGWSDTEAIGQVVRVDSTAYTIVGVVHDFHYWDFGSPIAPVFLRAVDPEQYRFMVARVVVGTTDEVIAFLETTWLRALPDASYDPLLQAAVFDRYYAEMDKGIRVFLFTALMALLLSCMGLFGMAGQNVARRMKEISIRKVLGASGIQVTKRVGRSFFVLLLLAALVASPLSLLFLEPLLQSISPYYKPIGATPFLVTYSLVFLIALLTISVHMYTIVTTNPAQVLRNE